jgi:hypothetical protein
MAMVLACLRPAPPAAAIQPALVATQVESAGGGRERLLADDEGLAEGLRVIPGPRRSSSCGGCSLTSIFRESCGQGPGRVGRLPSAGSVSCCRHGALAHVGDVLSQPGRTPILRGSVLQLLKDPIQAAAWPLRGQQHRQVQQPPGVW